MAKRKRKKHLRKHWQGKRKSEGERRRTEVRKKTRQTDDSNKLAARIVDAATGPQRRKPRRGRTHKP